MKGASLEDGIKAFTTANKGITKSDGQKLINIFEDVKKNTATVTDLQKFKDKKGIKSIPVKEQFTTKPNVEEVYFDNPNDPRLFKPNIKTQAQDFQTFGKEVIDDLNAPIKPDLEVVKNKTFNVKSPLVQDDALRIKQGLSTRIKLNSENENAQMVKDLILRKNKEFNSLNRPQQKEILDRIQNQIKESKAKLAKPVNPDDEMPFASGGLARVGFGLGKLVLKDFPEWAIKKFKELNKLKTYYSKNPPNNKDTLKLYNLVVNQRQKALRHTLEVGGDEAMFNSYRVGPYKDIPDIGQKVKFSQIPTDEPKTMRNVKGQFGFDFVDEGVGSLDNKTIRKAVDDIFPTGDYKYDAEMAAEALVENNPKAFGNKLYDDLSDADRSDVYGAVLPEVQNDLAKMLQAKRLSKPTKTLEGLKKEGTIDISNPEVADEFTRFMRESDPKGYKDLEQKVDLSNLDIKGKKGHASGGIAGQLHMNEGGRVPMIFGGSPGLKGLIASIKAGLNKGRKDKIKTLFPTYSAAEKELLKLGEKYLPQDSATLAAKEIQAKAEGIDILINRLKHDKKLLERQAKNKAMNDPNLDFMMESLEKTMPEAYGPHLKKYTNIDKDILQLETIKKNLIMKDRKLNAEGGLQTLNRPGYDKGKLVYGMDEKPVNILEDFTKYPEEARGIIASNEAKKLAKKKERWEDVLKFDSGSKINRMFINDFRGALKNKEKTLFDKTLAKLKIIYPKQKTETINDVKKLINQAAVEGQLKGDLLGNAITLTKVLDMGQESTRVDIQSPILNVSGDIDRDRYDISKDLNLANVDLGYKTTFDDGKQISSTYDLEVPFNIKDLENKLALERSENKYNTSNLLKLDSNYNIGNLTTGLTGSVEKDDYGVDSELRPSLSYKLPTDYGTFSASANKDLIEGGDANALLSYVYGDTGNPEDKENFLRLSAQLDPIEGDKKAFIGFKSKFNKGGRASLSNGGLANILGV